MKINEALKCPRCGGHHFKVKREATYVYTYNLEAPKATEQSGSEEALPYLFDNREQTYDNEYLQCQDCNAQYPCDIDRTNSRIQYTILQKAIRSDHQENPEFLG